jgi:hypothetical protein
LHRGTETTKEERRVGPVVTRLANLVVAGALASLPVPVKTTSTEVAETSTTIQKKMSDTFPSPIMDDGFYKGLIIGGIVIAAVPLIWKLLKYLIKVPKMVYQHRSEQIAHERPVFPMHCRIEARNVVTKGHLDPSCSNMNESTCYMMPLAAFAVYEPMLCKKCATVEMCIQKARSLLESDDVEAQNRLILESAALWVFRRG